MFLRKYGVGSGAEVILPMIKRGAVDFAVSADWTPAAGDVTLSKDGGAAVNIATLPVAVAMGNGAGWKFVFSNAELQARQITVTVVDAAPKAVEDNMFILETFGHPSALYPGIDLTDSVRLGMTALPNASPATNGGLPTVNAGNYLAGIAGTKNTLDALNDLSAVAVENAVLDADVSTHHTAAGSAGARIDAAGTAGDPWSVPLPGSYAPGTAGAMLDLVNEKTTFIKAKTDNLPASPAAVGSAMTLDLTQPVPVTNTTQTVGDALNAARAQGFGNWTLTGDVLTLYAAGGVTPVHSFTLDDPNNPTSRT